MAVSQCVRRILSDMHDLNKEPLDKEGIFYEFNEDNITDMKALIIGPKDTPYQDGFYFFDFRFPNNYPLSPPVVVSCTQFGGVRYNPNLYTNGKVCLSIINTWSGPSWTPCNTIRSVLMSLVAMVFVENPLRNEPGYEKSSIKTLDEYNAIIEHENFRGSILYMLNNPPNGFEIFSKHLNKYYVDNYERIYSNALTLKNIRDKNTYSIGVYNLKLTCNYGQILKDLNIQYSKITGKSIKKEYLLEDLNSYTVAQLREKANELCIDIRHKVGNVMKFKLKKELLEDIKDKLKE